MTVAVQVFLSDFSNSDVHIDGFDASHFFLVVSSHFKCLHECWVSFCMSEMGSVWEIQILTFRNSGSSIKQLLKL